MLSLVQPRLDTYDIAAEALLDVAGHVRLHRREATADYALVSGPSVALQDARRRVSVDQPVLLVTTYVSTRTADALRRAGVQYVDTAGNAWIEFGDVLVDVQGRARAEAAGPVERAPAGNLFSAGRAQVICILLTWPELWTGTQRQLARAAGVSVGQANNALDLLAAAGYGPERRGPSDLLDLWAAAFPTGLAHRLNLATFHGQVDSVKKVDPVDRLFLSGEGAVTDLLRPATLVVYADGLDPRLPIVNRWRADGPPTVTVRRAFWNAPDGDVSGEGATPAPWPIVYADLLASSDPRVRTAAREWRSLRARPQPAV